MADPLPPSAREVLHDLVTQRALVDWRREQLSSAAATLLVGGASLARLQENRLHRKRKTKTKERTAEGGGDAAEEETGEERVERMLCGFVVVDTAHDATVSLERLMGFHAAAVAVDDSIERVYLCLADAGSISYYHLSPAFPRR